LIAAANTLSARSVVYIPFIALKLKSTRPRKIKLPAQANENTRRILRWLRRKRHREDFEGRALNGDLSRAMTFKKDDRYPPGSLTFNGLMFGVV
jgi:hypothetical protein